MVGMSGAWPSAAEADEALDATGRTKLIKACEDKDVLAARSLLTSRASPDKPNNDQQSPLYVACRSGSRSKSF